MFGIGFPVANTNLAGRNYLAGLHSSNVPGRDWQLAVLVTTSATVIPVIAARLVITPRRDLDHCGS
jgi:hypothetical protein